MADFRVLWSFCYLNILFSFVTRAVSSFSWGTRIMDFQAKLSIELFGFHLTFRPTLIEILILVIENTSNWSGYLKFIMFLS